METVVVMLLLFLGVSALLLFVLFQDRGPEETVDRSEALRRAHAGARRRADRRHTGGDEDLESDADNAVRDR